MIRTDLKLPKVLRVHFLLLAFFFSVTTNANFLSWQSQSAKDLSGFNIVIDPGHDHDQVSNPSAIINLIDWMWQTAKLPPEDLTDVDPYNRLKHFGTWVKRLAGRCENTRGFVLIRDSDSSVPIRYNPSGCTISSGLWHDPYTGEDFTNASKDIQIDHVVPLKHAYQHGGYKWTPPVRCHYANFMGNEFHLMAVNGTENMRKSDHSPEEYVPPNSEYKCRYLGIWLKIKAIWKLSIDRSEALSISEQARAQGCTSEEFEMTSQELNQQIRASKEVIPACQDFAMPNPEVAVSK